MLPNGEETEIGEKGINLSGMSFRSLWNNGAQTRPRWAAGNVDEHVFAHLTYLCTLGSRILGSGGLFTVRGHLTR